jgi:hypothetical protein
MGFSHQIRVRTWKSASELSGARSLGTTFGSDGQLEVALLFTSPEATINALEKMAALLAGLNARINLIAVQSVPYTLALNNPAVPISFNEQRLQDIASESPIETTASLYICRCPFETLTSVLKRGSILVVGIRRKRWPTWEKRLARKLHSAGVRVVPLEVR